MNHEKRHRHFCRHFTNKKGLIKPITKKDHFFIIIFMENDKKITTANDFMTKNISSRDFLSKYDVLSHKC